MREYTSKINGGFNTKFNKNNLIKSVLEKEMHNLTEVCKALRDIQQYNDHLTEKSIEKFNKLKPEIQSQVLKILNDLIKTETPIMDFNVINNAENKSKMNVITQQNGAINNFLFNEAPRMYRAFKDAVQECEKLALNESQQDLNASKKTCDISNISTRSNESSDRANIRTQNDVQNDDFGLRRDIEKWKAISRQNQECGNRECNLI